MTFWPLLALIFSFCGAVIVSFNHYAQLDGTRLVVLRWFGVAPLALLAFFLLPWPTSPAFYAAAAIMGIGLAVSDKLLFNAAHKHGGRLASLYIPIKMLMGFTLWAVIQPASLMPLATPWKATCILAGFALCCGAMLYMRKEHTSRTALLAILPVAALLAMGDVVAKDALNTNATTLWQVIGSATAFLAVTTTIGSLVGLLMAGFPKTPFALPNRRELFLASLFGAILLVSLSLFLVTLALSPNPGYVGAITMLSTLWLSLHGYFHHKERTNWWGGIALLAGAILVAIATA
jgi:hypothetical protein